MYDQALRVAPLETAAELYKSVMESHHRWCSKPTTFNIFYHIYQVLLGIPSKLFSTGITSSHLASSSSASSLALASALAGSLAGLHSSSTNMLCQQYLLLHNVLLNQSPSNLDFVQAQRGDEKKMSRSTDPLAHRVSLKFEDHPFLLELSKTAFL